MFFLNFHFLIAVSPNNGKVFQIPPLVLGSLASPTRCSFAWAATGQSFAAELFLGLTSQNFVHISSFTLLIQILGRTTSPSTPNRDSPPFGTCIKWIHDIKTEMWIWPHCRNADLSPLGIFRGRSFSQTYDFIIKNPTRRCPTLRQIRARIQGKNSHRALQIDSL